LILTGPEECAMTDPLHRPVTWATAGAACIAGSAVLMRLGGASASTTALLRCGFALPVLGALAWLERRRGAPPLPARSRWVARLAGVFLAADLILWSHAISAIGAGLATVAGNLQVLIVALLAWWLLGERPQRSLAFAAPVMVAGLVLVGGLIGSRPYGAHPVLGAVLGAGVSVLYAVYILMLRHTTAGRDGTPGAVVQPLYEATLGGTAGSLVLGFALHDFRLGPAWPALGWLALLALTSQVIGWLLITVAMPRLQAWLVSVLLLVQPAGSIALSAAALGERPSLAQLAGVALILAGVVIATSGRTRTAVSAPAAAAEAASDSGTVIVPQA
jgi:drug/metabolite transporter (DMT)-like permease